LRVSVESWETVLEGRRRFAFQGIARPWLANASS
jgi:hypothetical protein